MLGGGGGGGGDEPCDCQPISVCAIQFDLVSGKLKRNFMLLFLFTVIDYMLLRGIHSEACLTDAHLSAILV